MTFSYMSYIRESRAVCIQYISCVYHVCVHYEYPSGEFRYLPTSKANPATVGLALKIQLDHGFIDSR